MSFEGKLSVSHPLRKRQAQRMGHPTFSDSTTICPSPSSATGASPSTIETCNANSLETGNSKLETHYSAVRNRSPYDTDFLRPTTARRAASRDRPHQASKQERGRHAGVLHREALYDAHHRRLDVVARRQADRVRLEHQRTQQSLAGAGDRRLADAVDHQRSAADAAGVVARRDLDRLHLRPRWG